jgi:hypothetical protein
MMAIVAILPHPSTEQTVTIELRRCVHQHTPGASADVGSRAAEIA